MLLAALGAGFLVAFSALPAAGASPLDAVPRRWMDAVRSPSLTRAATWITELGAVWWLAIVVIAGSVYAAVGRRNPRLGATYFLAALLGWGINYGLKALVARPRPDTAAGIASGWSFPSGHASGAVVVYGLLAYVLCRWVPSRVARAALVSTAAVLAAAIGVTRIYLGAHHASDVLAGVCWALVYSMLVIIARGDGDSTTPLGCVPAPR